MDLPITDRMPTYDDYADYPFSEYQADKDRVWNLSIPDDEAAKILTRMMRSYGIPYSWGSPMHVLALRNMRREVLGDLIAAFDKD